MQLGDGTFLMHANGTPYDPQKAHDYYVKRYKKHPRQSKGTYTIKGSNGKSYQISAQKLEEQKAYAQAQVANFKKNLSDLNVILRDKMEKAKASAAKAAKPPTLAEKAKAARDAQAYRASHKQELANKAKTANSKSSGSSSSNTKSTKAPVDTVDSLQKEIKSTRASLKSAVAKQRELAMAKKNG